MPTNYTPCAPKSTRLRENELLTTKVAKYKKQLSDKEKASRSVTDELRRSKAVVDTVEAAWAKATKPETEGGASATIVDQKWLITMFDQARAYQ